MCDTLGIDLSRDPRLDSNAFYKTFIETRPEHNLLVWEKNRRCVAHPTLGKTAFTSIPKRGDQFFGVCAHSLIQNTRFLILDEETDHGWVLQGEKVNGWWCPFTTPVEIPSTFILGVDIEWTGEIQSEIEVAWHTQSTQPEGAVRVVYAHEILCDTRLDNIKNYKNVLSSSIRDTPYLFENRFVSTRARLIRSE